MFSFLSSRKINTQEAALYEQILRDLPVGIVVYDTSFRIISINPSAEKLLGVNSQKILGSKIETSSAADPSLKLLVQVIYSSLAPVVILRSEAGVFPQIADVSFDDPQLDVRIVTDRYIDQGGRVAGFIKILVDKTRENALLKAKTDFIGVAAHQLRTPLTAINWSLEMLAGESLSESQMDVVKTARSASQNALATVNNLLDVTKIEEGKFGYAFEQIGLSEFLKGILSQLQPVANQLSVHLYFDAPQGDVFVTADPQKLGMVFMNLFDNAIKYNVQNGSVTVVVSRSSDARDALITITDTGIGIPQDQVQSLFSKFFRADNAIKTVADGTGLGLYIARNIVQRHGGDIAVHSEINRGTVFSVTLPLDPSRIPHTELFE